MLAKYHTLRTLQLRGQRSRSSSTWTCQSVALHLTEVHESRTKWRRVGPHIVMVIRASHLVSSDLLFRLRRDNLSQSSSTLHLPPAVKRIWNVSHFLIFVVRAVGVCVCVWLSVDLSRQFSDNVKGQYRCCSQTLSASSVATISYIFIFTWYWSVFVRVHSHFIPVYTFVADIPVIFLTVNAAGKLFMLIRHFVCVTACVCCSSVSRSTCTFRPFCAWCVRVSV